MQSMGIEMDENGTVGKLISWNINLMENGTYEKLNTVRLNHKNIYQKFIERSIINYFSIPNPLTCNNVNESGESS